MFYLVIISDMTNEFLLGDNKDLLNWIYEIIQSSFWILIQ